MTSRLLTPVHRTNPGGEIEMPDDQLTAEVPPITLIADRDVIVRDPDHPEDTVRWEVTAKEIQFGAVVIDYTTSDGKEGRHAFEEDPDARVVVEVKRRAVAA